jgi:hypothetical protein
MNPDLLQQEIYTQKIISHRKKQPRLSEKSLVLKQPQKVKCGDVTRDQDTWFVCACGILCEKVMESEPPVDSVYFTEGGAESHFFEHTDPTTKA